MNNLKTFTVTLYARVAFTGLVPAVSNADAIDLAWNSFCNDCPHPFEPGDAELYDVRAEEMPS